jgi:hypothetical protein
MNSLFSNIELRVQRPEFILREPPTIALLDHAERVLDFRFPECYREFALHFGAGELGEWYRFHVPGEDDDNSSYLVGNTRMMGRERTSRDEQDREVHNSDLVYFCSDVAGDAFAWDPHEVTDSARHEYKIYGWPRSLLDVRVTVAESFEELIAGFFDKTIPTKMHWQPDALKLPWVFDRWPADCPHNDAIYEADLKKRSKRSCQVNAGSPQQISALMAELAANREREKQAERDRQLAAEHQQAVQQQMRKYFGQ